MCGPLMRSGGWLTRLRTTVVDAEEVRRTVTELDDVMRANVSG
jgi:hypothetical protein